MFTKLKERRALNKSRRDLKKEVHAYNKYLKLNRIRIHDSGVRAHINEIRRKLGFIAK